MRLIDADAFSAVMKKRQDAVEEWMSKSKDEKTCARAESAYVMLVEVKLTLDKMPTIEAVPVVHGEWVGFPDSFKYEHVYDRDAIVCPFCEESWNIVDNDTERFNYCPNCGAKMDEEEKNDGQIK